MNHVSNLKYKDLEWVIDGAACDDQHENGGNKAANGNECFVPWGKIFRARISIVPNNSEYFLWMNIILHNILLNSCKRMIVLQKLIVNWNMWHDSWWWRCSLIKCCAT